jgi:NAD(P)-dependent dehydrogenase (short-subunit alcohol dehydrogenase family)
VLALARLGLDVAVHYRGDEAAARATAEEAVAAGARRAPCLRADLADPTEALGLAGRALEALGRVDVWVNNAGIAPPVRADLLDVAPADWDAVMATNLRGPFLATQAAARAMVEAAGRGELVDPQVHFITSISSVMASVNRGAYCVSKAGLSMVAQLWAVRLAAAGIRVFEVRPGVIDTDMTASVHAAYDARFAAGLAPINRWGTPDDVGRVVAGIVAGHLPYATGNVIEVDGGLHLRTF